MFFFQFIHETQILIFLLELKANDPTRWIGRVHLKKIQLFSSFQFEEKYCRDNVGKIWYLNDFFFFQRLRESREEKNLS